MMPNYNYPQYLMGVLQPSNYEENSPRGLLLLAALTSMLTGITEPIEFTFLFVAPLLYVIHSILAGVSYMLMHIFGVGVGMTFSGGLIDLTLFGILQGNAKTNWIWIVIVGLIYAVVYYFLFKLLISKFNFKTPGREADEEETKRSNDTGIISASYWPSVAAYSIIYRPHVLIPPFTTSSDDKYGEQNSTFSIRLKFQYIGS